MLIAVDLVSQSLVSSLPASLRTEIFAPIRRPPGWGTFYFSSGITSSRRIRHALPNFRAWSSPSAHRCRTVRSGILRIWAAVCTSIHRVLVSVLATAGMAENLRWANKKGPSAAHL